MFEARLVDGEGEEQTVGAIGMVREEAANLSWRHFRNYMVSLHHVEMFINNLTTPRSATVVLRRTFQGKVRSGCTTLMTKMMKYLWTQMMSTGKEDLGCHTCNLKI